MFITKSKIIALKTCPLSFKFKYITKQEPDTEKAPITNTGLDIHNIFNKFFDSFDISKIPDDPYDFFCNSMDIPEEYKSIFYKFCAWETELFKANKTNFIPIMREQKFKSLDLYGIVDRINFNGDIYSLIDYKSGIYNKSELRFELNFYKYLVDSSKVLDKPIEYIGSYGYNNGDVFFEKVNPHSYELMLSKVETFRQIKFKEISYPKKTGYHCQWCEYQIACSNTNSQTNFSNYI